MEIAHQEGAFDFYSTTPHHARPFLKWAGGKTNLLPILRKLVPTKFDRYIEAFVGGGCNVL